VVMHTPGVGVVWDSNYETSVLGCHSLLSIKNLVMLHPVLMRDSSRCKWFFPCGFNLLGEFRVSFDLSGNYLIHCKSVVNYS
jgi:hypothetical protein